MNILQINTTATGGAGKVAYRLHQSLKELGHQSSMLVGYKMTNNSDVLYLSNRNKSTLLKNMATDVLEKLMGFQYYLRRDIRKISQLKVFKEADVIHLHNIHGGYVHFDIVRQIAKHKPIVWTLHDMWAITGYCLHSYDCERWKTGCGHCPLFKTSPKFYRDTTHILWERKRRIYEACRGNLSIVVPSQWLLDKVEESIMSNLDIHYIGNAVDTRIFRVQNKHEVRERLNLPKDQFIVSFVASGGSANRWKGFAYALEALRILRDREGLKPYLLVIGNKKTFDLSALGHEGKVLERIDDEKLMADFYSASDAYLMSSLAENSPLVVIESLACEKPVVGFNVGGVPELIQHKISGYLAQPRDATDLADGIRFLMSLTDEQYSTMSRACVDSIQGKHDMKTHTNKYLTLYNKIGGTLAHGYRQKIAGANFR